MKATYLKIDNPGFGQNVVDEASQSLQHLAALQDEVFLHANHPDLPGFHGADLHFAALGLDPAGLFLGTRASPLRRTNLECFRGNCRSTCQPAAADEEAPTHGC